MGAHARSMILKGAASIPAQNRLSGQGYVSKLNGYTDKEIIASSAQADASHYGKTQQQVMNEYADIVYGNKWKRGLSSRFITTGKTIIGG